MDKEGRRRSQQSCNTPLCVALCARHCSLGTRVSQAPWTMEALWPTIEAPELCIMISALRCCSKSWNNIQESTVKALLPGTRIQEGFSKEKGQIKATYVPYKVLHTRNLLASRLPGSPADESLTALCDAPATTLTDQRTPFATIAGLR